MYPVEASFKKKERTFFSYAIQIAFFRPYDCDNCSAPFWINDDLSLAVRLKIFSWDVTNLSNSQRNSHFASEFL